MRRSEARERRRPPSWSDLVSDQPVTVVKLAPDGLEAARYVGVVSATIAPESWVIVQADWTYPSIEMDGLAFNPGDLLLEWFSPDLFFNAFAVFSPGQRLRGWYANVTRPAYLHGTDAEGWPVLVWHDLYLDMIGLPGGRSVTRDVDELESSSLQERDPALYRNVWAAGDELQRRFAHQQAPFLSEQDLATLLRVPAINREHL